MRWTAAVIIVGLMALPGAAEAAWEQYINEEFHFGADFPAEPTQSTGMYRGAVSGERASNIFETVVDGITFRATIVDISDQLVDAGSILEEAVYIWGLDGEITVDMSARADPWESAAYGRRLSIVKEDGSHATAAFFATRGNLYIFEAIASADSDASDPGPGRFAQSVLFNIELDWSVWPPVPRETAQQ